MLKQTKNPGKSAPAPAAKPIPKPDTYDWSQASVQGFENVNQEDLGIPFLSILQKLSPQIDKDSADYESKGIQGAEVGDIINTLSNTVVCGMGEELEFIPCTYQRLYMEWKTRESGGGLVKTHPDSRILQECQRNERGQDILRNGNIIATTAYFYGMYLLDGERTPCVIGMTSTQLKKAKQWLNMAMSIKFKGANGPYTPPLFSHSYRLSTVAESNDSGNWRGWAVNLGGPLSDPVMIAEAMDFAKRATQVRAGLNAPPAEDAEKVL